MKDLSQGKSYKDTLYGSSVARASCEDICDGTSVARGEL